MDAEIKKLINTILDEAEKEPMISSSSNAVRRLREIYRPIEDRQMDEFYILNYKGDRHIRMNLEEASHEMRQMRREGHVARLYKVVEVVEPDV